MKRDVRPWRGVGGRIKEKQGGRHRLVFKSWTALPWQQAGTWYTQKGLGQCGLIILYKLSCLLTVSAVILDG